MAKAAGRDAMFSKQDQIQGYDDALLAAMNAESSARKITSS
jgi:hypothetical protein